MKEKTIVVTNIYGTYNLGDNAIRNSSLRLLDESLEGGRLLLLTETTRDFPMKRDLKHSFEIEFSPYGYGIESEGKPKPLIAKLLRFALILGASVPLVLLGSILPGLLPENGPLRYMRWIRGADLVVVMGGGFFMSTNAGRDFFGTILNVLPLYVARFYRKPVVVLPISFGPFAHPLHERITGNALRGATVYCRDRISLKKVKPYNPDARFIPDMALYDWPGGSKSGSKTSGAGANGYCVLSLREYLKDGQDNVEAEIAAFADRLFKEKKIQCRYVPMGANPIEENDVTVGERLKAMVKTPHAFEIMRPKTPDELKKLLAGAEFSVCNRMHTAILSATVHTPFVAIAYQHKTHGFLESFGLQDWNVDMHEVTQERLYKKVSALLKKENYRQFMKLLEGKRMEIATERTALLAQLRESLGYKH